MTRKYPQPEPQPEPPLEEKRCKFCGLPFLGGEHDTVCNRCIARAVSEDMIYDR